MSILKPGIPVALCCDHAGYDTKMAIIDMLNSKEIAYEDFGTCSTESVDYPDYAHPCAIAVEKGKCYPGIAICGTGNGIAMTLNKHQHIRAALCWDIELAKMARAHNDANILVLPGRFVDNSKALEIVKTFLETPFEGGRHSKRIEKIPVK